MKKRTAITGLMVAGVSVFVMTQYARAQQNRIPLMLQDNHIVEIGDTSPWFVGGASKCSAWLTCKQAGGTIEELYVTSGGESVTLGTIVMGTRAVDVSGNSPVGTYMRSCEGGDEGISVSRYNEGTGDDIIITIKNDDSARERQYTYALPTQFSNKSQQFSVGIVFQTQTGERSILYYQETPAVSC